MEGIENMAIEDLDLEFEDEEEGQKGDALDVGVDVTFATSQGGSTRNSTRPSPVPKKKESTSTQTSSNVRPLRKESTSSSPGQGGGSDIQILREEIASLRQQLHEVQNEAAIKVAVAEAEKKYLVEYVSEVKLLDHQVTNELKKIHSKVPQLKNEVQIIKKLMQDFLLKIKK